MSGSSPAPSCSLRLDHLVRVFHPRGQPVRAVDEVSLEVAAGEFYTLLGPSGCGKSTTLRCVAGLERPDGGRIEFDGRTVSGPGVFVPPHRRNIGMVFQSYAIWPHLSVFENVAFPLRVAGPRLPRRELAARVEEALTVVRLTGLENRGATELSGGQQQRLALARALVRRPGLLLLDEPLSNLDARLRDQVRAEIRQLQQRLGITTLYVTHDQAEALSMSDRVAVMSQGRIAQEATPTALYRRPASEYVARFVGSANVLAAEVLTASSDNRLRLRTVAGELEARCGFAAKPGDGVSVAVRPERILLHSSPPAGANTIPAVVEQVGFLGQVFEVHARARDLTVVVHCPDGRGRGEHVFLELPADACVVMRPDA
jgi:iron(III) transport system ATP-binding protein